MHQDNGSLWDMLPLSRMTPPVSGDFTWVNQGQSTVADTKGMMVLTTPPRRRPTVCGAWSRVLRGLLMRSPSACCPSRRPIHRMPRLPSLASVGARAVQASCSPMDGAWATIRSSSPTINGRTPRLFPPTNSCTRHPSSRRSGFGFRTTARIEWSRYRVTDSTLFPSKVSQSRTAFLTADQVGVFANSWKTSNGIPRVISSCIGVNPNGRAIQESCEHDA